MKYLLINQQTGQETICDKVTVDGFDYYACREEIRLNDPITDGYRVWFWEDNCSLLGRQKVIATNNPNIDIPQVVDETLDYKFDREFFNPLIAPIVNEIEQKDYRLFLSIGRKLYDVLFENYKSQETHPFSEEDMIEFNEWCETSAEANLFWRRNRIDPKMDGSHNKIRKHKMKELLQLWKFQQPQKVYYEK